MVPILAIIIKIHFILHKCHRTKGILYPLLMPILSNPTKKKIAKNLVTALKNPHSLVPQELTKVLKMKTVSTPMRSTIIIIKTPKILILKNRDPSQILIVKINKKRTSHLYRKICVPWKENSMSLLLTLFRLW